MEMSNLEKLHIKCSKLTSDEIIALIFQLAMQGKPNDKLHNILKIYLYRALKREGIEWKNF